MISINKKRLGFYIIVILLLVLLWTNTSSAQIPFNYIEKIEPEVLSELNNYGGVQVIIKLNSKNDAMRDSVLVNLSESEFKFEEKNLRGDGFVGNITKEGLDKLANNPNVRVIYLNRVAHILLQQSLPLINATQVWVQGYTGKGQTVCVIDTGINWSHLDLGGCKGSGCKVLGGYDYYNNDSDPMDDNGHGTYVAGIVASQDPTYKGIAYDAD